MGDRGVQGNASNERSFSHAGARGNDHEITPLEAPRHLVQRIETGGNTGYASLGGLQLLNALEGRVEDLLDPDKAFTLMRLRNLEDALLRDIQYFLDSALTRLVRVLDDAGGCLDELAQQSTFANDARMVFDIGGTASSSSPT
jgi:hypothetical protein